VIANTSCEHKIAEKRIRRLYYSCVSESELLLTKYVRSIGINPEHKSKELSYFPVFWQASSNDTQADILYSVQTYAQNISDRPKVSKVKVKFFDSGTRSHS
jgi:hypothetical protein